MTNERAYRLGEYRITVYDDVLVRWERHVPLGISRFGKCFLYGDVLIIGGKSHDEDGYLIGEFHDELRKLPPWIRTSYCCFAGELFDVVTGQSLTDEDLERLSFFAGMNRAVPEKAAITAPRAYRLGNYHITAATGNRISWRAYGDLNRIAGGPCSITSGILVIGPQEYNEPAKGKREFTDALNRLQLWDRTMAWSRGPVLRLCRDQGAPRKLRETAQITDIYWKPEEPKERREQAFGRIFESEQAGPYREALIRLSISGWNAVKSAWQRTRIGKNWLKWLLVLMVSCCCSICRRCNLHFRKRPVPDERREAASSWSS